MADPTFTAPPPAPSRASPSTFSDLTDPFLAWFVTFQPELDFLVPWLAGNVVDVAANTAIASASAEIAQGAANYQGEYDAGTLYAIGESVTYLGSQYIKKSAAAAGTTPVDGVDWLEIAGEILLTHATTTGAAQTLDFTNDYQTIVSSEPVVTVSFSTTKEVQEVTAFVDYRGLPFDLSDAFYTGNFYNPPGATTLKGVEISSDGRKLYTSYETEDRIYQATLSTPYDLSTAVDDGTSLSVVGEDSLPGSISMSADGTKLFVLGDTNDIIYQYTLSTAFDVSTGTYDDISFDPAAQSAFPNGIDISPDGTKLYIVDSASDLVIQYTLSTPFNVRTATYGGLNFGFGAQTTSLAGARINSDGTKMVALSLSPEEVFEYTLSTAFDVSTATYTGNSLNILSEDTAPLAIAFSKSDNRFYISGTDTDLVYQYTVTLSSLILPTEIQTETISPQLGFNSYVFATVDSGASYFLVSKAEGLGE